MTAAHSNVQTWNAAFGCVIMLRQLNNNPKSLWNFISYSVVQSGTFCMWSLVFILLLGPHRSAAYRVTVSFIDGLYVRGRVSALAFGPA